MNISTQHFTRFAKHHGRDVVFFICVLSLAGALLACENKYRRSSSGASGGTSGETSGTSNTSGSSSGTSNTSGSSTTAGATTGGGGGIDPDSLCDRYCNAVMDVCAVLFATEDECQSTCASYNSNAAIGAREGDSLQCRLFYAETALQGEDLTSNCTNASISGGSVCVSAQDLCANPNCSEGEYCSPVTGFCSDFSCNNIDPDEPNNERATAVELTAGVTSEQNFCRNDDWFKINVPTPGSMLYVAIEFQHSLADIDARLTDANQNTIDLGQEDENGEYLVGANVEAGDYFIDVNAFRPESDSFYTITAFINPPLNLCDTDGSIGCPTGQFCQKTKICGAQTCTRDEDCTDRAAPTCNVARQTCELCTVDVLEPNSSAQPRDITNDRAPGETLTTCQDDDVYSINAEVGQIITVEILFSHARGDIDVTLEGPTGRPLSVPENLQQDAVGSSDTDNEVFSALVSDSGRHLLRVFERNGKSNDYTMSVLVR